MTNVNRVPETWGQQVEKARLVEETVDSTPPLIEAKTEFRVPPHVGETVVLQPGQTAVMGPGYEQEEIPETVFSPAADLISEALKMYRDRQMSPDFQKQVIAAFKHLGLDTRKFFGV